MTTPDDPRLNAIARAFAADPGVIGAGLDEPTQRYLALIAVQAIDGLRTRDAVEREILTAERSRAWTWKRVHAASDGEAVALARTVPGVDPADPASVMTLLAYRAGLVAGTPDPEVPR